MALDESVRQFVGEVLELRLIDLRGRGGEPIQAGTVKMRLNRLWSFGGQLRGGVGRIECGQRLWVWFSSPTREGFDFTNKLWRYQIHLCSDEPQAHTELGIPISGTTAAAGFGMISAGRMSTVPRRYPVPTEKILAQILSVPVSVDRWMPYRPCDVVLKNGRRVDRVYVVPEEPYILMWGVWPEDDRGKSSVLLDELAEVRDSRHRLPAPFAQKLYSAGEPEWAIWSSPFVSLMARISPFKAATRSILLLTLQARGPWISSMLFLTLGGKIHNFAKHQDIPGASTLSRSPR